ncbi:MAG: DUF4411 family protein [Pseudohongiellaceae bacterium]
MSTGDRYCIDTSALIHAWVRAYPEWNFPSFWSNVDDLIDANRLTSSVEVLEELRKKNDELVEWANGRDPMFRDLDDAIQERVTEILGTYPRLVDTRKNRSMADPFVVALASLYDPMLIVITEEGASGKIDKPRMPDVCNAEGIDCISLVELITREGWRM